MKLDLENPRHLWVLTDSQGEVLHSSSDERSVVFMRTLLARAESAGDKWKLLRYRLDAVEEPQNTNTKPLAAVR